MAFGEVLPCLLILFILIGVGLTDEDLVPAPYYFPEDSVVPWHPIPLSSVTCPPHHMRPSGNAHRVKIESPYRTHHSNATVEGVVCYTATFSVRCVVNFIGWRTLEHYIEPKQSDLGECRSLAAKADRGEDIPSPTFPAPNCVWWSENWASSTHVHVSSHLVFQDPYSETLADPLFPGGKCSDSACPLIHKGGFWIRTGGFSSLCTNWEEVTGLLGTFGEVTVVAPEVGPSRVLTGGCKMHYCGREGIRLKQGEFITIQEGPGYTLLRDLMRPCSPGQIVKTGSKRPFASWLEYSVAEEEERLECLTHLSLSVATHKASPELLGALSPYHAGPGLAYRVNNGTLEVAKVTYVPVYEASKVNDRTLIGYGPNGIPVRWTSWVTWGNRTSGPGGTYHDKRGRVIVPHFEKRRLEYDREIHTFSELRDVPHPHVTIYSNFSDIIAENQHTSGQASDGWAKISNWFKSMWGSFTWTFVAIIVCLVVGICSVKKLLPCIRKRRQRPERWGDIEMSTWENQ
uniref:Glycoprotein n=1 Tax=Tongren Rhabd tick virus 3 TaxID=2972337 RepID=A0A9E8AAQ0_9RHAB|nr:MAG: glycoprotein [Tongren Rhabd tick virus 3]